VKQGVTGVQIARYDTSGNTDYYEVIETIN
jgi:hypothetical protein